MGLRMVTTPHLCHEYVCTQVEGLTEVCAICKDEFVTKEDLLHHMSVRHPGQEAPSTSMSSAPCGDQENDDDPGTSKHNYLENKVKKGTKCHYIDCEMIFFYLFYSQRYCCITWAKVCK